jgi:hypothetical protein
LNAPWGAGKSFLYKLIKAELERNNIRKIQEENNKKKNKKDETEVGIFENPFKFLSDKEILSSMCKRVNTLWTDLKNQMSQHPCISIFYFFIFFILVGLVCAMHILTYLIIGIFGVLPWAIWCVLVNLFSESINVAFHTIIRIIQAVTSVDRDAVQIAAILLVTPLVWFLPWVVFFILSCFEKIIGKLIYCFFQRNLFDNL